MAKTPTIIFDKGWKKFQTAIDPLILGPVLEKQIARANKFNALLVQRTIRTNIKKKVAPPNAKLTILIKHSRKPLVDRGDLFQAINIQHIDWKTSFIGIFDSSPAYDMGKVVHDGATIPVTQKMRNMFWLLWQVSIGALPESVLSGRAAELWQRAPTHGRNHWKPIKPATTHIIIPARPFIRTAFEDAALGAAVKGNWTKAINAAIKQASGGGSV
jgi:hypothetical protein